MRPLRRLWNLLRARHWDREFEEELEFHRQMRIHHAQERGLNPTDAEADAKRHMGSLTLAKEDMREARMAGYLESIWRDLRHGITLLYRDPGTSALSILVLALGIGASAAIFTLFKAAFLDPLPYRDHGRLVTVIERSESVVGEQVVAPSDAEYLAIRDRTRTLDAVAYMEHRDMQVSGTSEPARIFAARVTASFFSLLGVSAAMGRTFTGEEDQPGRTPAVILTDSFWRLTMGADPAAVGRTLRLDGQAALIVGVLPPDFHFDYPTLRIPEPVDLYVSFPIDRSAPFRSSFATNTRLRVLARLRHGATEAQARSDLQSIARALMQEQPEAYRTRDGGHRSISLEPLPLRDAIVGTQRSLLSLLLGSVGILLLIGCANTAQLLLARSLRRTREVAIRCALGASRLRLVRQFLMEGLVLAFCGGVAGLLISGVLARLLVALLPVRSPLLEAAQVDLRVVAFALALSVLSSLAFAVIPAITGSQWTPGTALAARSGAGHGNRWRHVMVALEAGLSVFLLCGAGLVARNLWTLISAPMGFDPNHVVVFRLKPPPQPTGAARAPGVPFRQYLDSIAAIPGVESAATVTGPPLRPSVSGPVELVGVRNPGGALQSVIVDNHLVSSGYFRTLRIPLLAGRMFQEQDCTEPWRTVIVNEEFARRFGAGRDIVGKQIFEPGQPTTILGMVGNVRTRGLRTDPFPEAYLCSLRFSWTNQYLVVRSSVPPAQLVKDVKSAIRSTNPDQAVFGVMSMEELISDSVTEPRFHAFLTAMFALLAVAMAAA
jgi:predicted permease